MKNSVEFVLHVKPVGTNHAYKKRGKGFGMYMTKEGKQYKEMLGWAANGQQMFERPEVWLTFTYGTKHKVDIDSAIKLTLDSFNGVLWEDDSLIELLHVKKLYKKKDPSVKVKVAEKGTGETW